MDGIRGRVRLMVVDAVGWRKIDDRIGGDVGEGERRLCSGCGRVSARRGAPAAARHDSTPGEPRTYLENISTRSLHCGPPKFVTIHIYIYTPLYICIYIHKNMKHTKEIVRRA